MFADWFSQLDLTKPTRSSFKLIKPAFATILCTMIRGACCNFVLNHRMWSHRSPRLQKTRPNLFSGFCTFLLESFWFLGNLIGCDIYARISSSCYRFGLLGNWIFGCCFDMNVCASNGTKHSLLPGKKKEGKRRKLQWNSRSLKVEIEVIRFIISIDLLGNWRLLFGRSSCRCISNFAGSLGFQSQCFRREHPKEACLGFNGKKNYLQQIVFCKIIKKVPITWKWDWMIHCMHGIIKWDIYISDFFFKIFLCLCLPKPED